MTKPTGKPRGRPPKARADAEARNDGMMNVLMNIGGRGDPNTHSKYTLANTIDRVTLSSIFRSDGIGRRVVEILPDEALREWVECDESLAKELGRLKAKQLVKDGGTWARLYGGALVLAIVDDGQEFDMPLRVNGIRKLVALRVYDRHNVSYNVYDTDTKSANFGKPLIYTISPPSGTPFSVHYSRVHIMDGASLPQEERQRNQGWGDSSLQTVYQALMNYGLTMTATAGIIRDFVQVVLSVKGLTEMLRAGQDDIVAKRINLIDMTRSVNNAIYLDADGEQYSKQASSVAGLADLWEKFAQHISASTGIPMSKLMGEGAGGLAATGEGDRKAWYDVVRAYQSDEVQPVIQWIIDLLGAQTEWTAKPEDLDWSFPALEQVNEGEWAKVKLDTANADKIYIDSGAVDPEYLYSLRYGSGEFKTEIAITDEGYQEWLMTRPIPDMPDEPEVPVVVPVERVEPVVSIEQMAEDAVSKAVLKQDQQRDDTMTRAILDALKDG